MNTVEQRASCYCFPGLTCAECVDAEHRAAVPVKGQVIDIFTSSGVTRVRVTRVAWSDDWVSATVHTEPA